MKRFFRRHALWLGFAVVLLPLGIFLELMARVEDILRRSSDFFESTDEYRFGDVHTAKLRKKIEDNPGEPSYIITVHRVGYKFTG